MSLSDLSFIGSFVSGVAVAVTLVLLLLQMRQTNWNQKALMQQGRSARVISTILKSTEPYVSEAISRALIADVSLTATQVRSFNAYATALFWNLEDSFLQYKAGLLDQAGWSIDVETLRVTLTQPAYRVAWRLARAQSSGAYRDFVDSLLRETSPAKPYDELATWKSLMATELAAGSDSAAT